LTKRNPPRFHPLWAHGPFTVRVHAWLGGHHGGRSRGHANNRLDCSALR
jgi:hypothetical protein